MLSMDASLGDRLSRQGQVTHPLAGGVGADQRAVCAEAGFSLIEVTVALLLFAALVLVMGAYYPKASLGGQLGRNMTYATHLAEAAMEEIRSKDFRSVTPSLGGSTIFTQWGIAFTRTVTIVPCSTVSTPPCSTSADLTEVSVAVSWLEPSTNSTKTTTLTTLIHDYF